MDTLTDLSKRFKEFRKREGLSQELLAMELDISQSAISRYDLAEVEVPAYVIKHLHQKYKMSYEWFFHGTGRRTSIDNSKPTIMTDLGDIKMNIEILSQKMKKMDRDIKLLASRK